MTKEDTGLALMLMTSSMGTLTWALDKYIEKDARVLFAMAYTLSLGAAVSLLKENITPMFLAAALALGYHIIVRSYVKEAAS